MIPSSAAAGAVDNNESEKYKIAAFFVLTAIFFLSVYIINTNS
jgi:hypothetical protein